LLPQNPKTPKSIFANWKILIFYLLIHNNINFN